jgi:hypothetical protein
LHGSEEQRGRGQAHREGQQRSGATADDALAQRVAELVAERLAELNAEPPAEAPPPVELVEATLLSGGYTVDGRVLTRGITVTMRREDAEMPAAQQIEVYGRQMWRPGPGGIPLAQLTDRGGLEPLRMHEGRQSFITSALAAGLDVRRVMEMAGHKTSAMTLERYARVHRADDERAAAALDAYHARSNAAFPHTLRREA